MTKRFMIFIFAMTLLTLFACNTPDAAADGTETPRNPADDTQPGIADDAEQPEELTEPAEDVTAEIDENDDRYRTYRQINSIIEENDYDWITTQRRPAADSHVDDSQVGIYTFENEEKTFIAALNKHLSDNDSKYLIFNFGMNGESMEHYVELYESFMQNDINLAWDILGQVYGEPEAIAMLQQQCMEYINETTWDSNGGNLQWCGREGDIHCSATLFWNGGLEEYVLSDIVVQSNNHFKMENRENGLARTNNYLDIITVAEIPVEQDTAADAEFNLITYAVKGRLEDIQPVTDELDGLDSSAITYPNTDLYQKAQLVDDTGSITVYIPPTSMTEEELSEELLHVIVVNPGEEPFYFIEMSISELDEIPGS